MRLLILAVALCATVCLAKSDKKIVCYFGGWTVYRQGNGKFEIPRIDPNLCTHLIYTFTGLRNGVIVSLDPYADLAENYGKDGFGQVYRLKEKNPNLKNILAIGGWNEGSQKYSEAVRTEAGRTKLADSIVEFVQKYRFDGFDFDWEYPAQRGGIPEDKKNYILFLQELHEKLGSHGLELSVAVSANINTAPDVYDIPALADAVDFINLMAYDFHGAWDKFLGHNSPLYASPVDTGAYAVFNIDSAVTYWLKQGVPPEKLILGVAFYGRTFTMADKKRPTLGSPAYSAGHQGQYTRESGFLSFLELCETFSKGGWTHVYDEIQRVPHAYKGDQWVGYDDQGSLQEKAEYALEKNLGGIMLWSLDSDDCRDVCGMGTYPLLKTINHVLHDGVKPSKPNQPSTTPESHESQKLPTTTSKPNLDELYPEIPVQTDPPISKPPSSKPPSSKPPSSTPPSTKPPSSTPPSSTPPSDEVCSQEGWFRNSKDCSGFYYCQQLQDGTLYAHAENHCPDGLYYNKITGLCDWPENVDC